MSVLALLAFIAAFFFFILAAFGVALGDVDLIPAGLASVAAGAVLDHLP